MTGARRSRRSILLLLGAAAVLSMGSSGDDPRVFAALAVILVAAKLCGHLARRLGQPGVLGELIAGILLGNLPLVGIGALEFAIDDPIAKGLAAIGVVILLFEVGLESDPVKMARVGVSAFAVAVVGVVLPMALGYGVHWGFAPESSWHTHLFIGATLAATSVGITARVLKDLGRVQTITGQIILGAAVIDDVLGLVVLAVVSGIVQAANSGGSIEIGGLLWIIAKAVAFLGVALALGRPAARYLFRVATWLEVERVLLAAALAFCFALAFAAAQVGLAPIVGAFAAGLVLDEVHYRELAHREAHGLEVRLEPLSGFLVPIFFVITGAAVDLRVFGDAAVLGLAIGLTVAAIAGKQACALAARGPGVHPLSVGVGMIPRGEVGLIFADQGARLFLHGEAVIGPKTYAAVIVMVIVTTIITPPALTWSLRRAPAPPPT
jgi:Kef-type K+ transport system membrane component KefB